MGWASFPLAQETEPMGMGVTESSAVGRAERRWMVR